MHQYDNQKEKLLPQIEVELYYRVATYIYELDLNTIEYSNLTYLYYKTHWIYENQIERL